MANFKILDSVGFQLTEVTNRVHYYLKSTASINVEDGFYQYDQQYDQQLQQIESENDDSLRQIASSLLEKDNPQLIIAIHGYANREFGVKKWHKKIYDYSKEIGNANSVFIGYRWSSENIIQDDPQTEKSKPIALQDKIKFAFHSLPTIVLSLFITTLVLGIITVSLLLGKSAVSIPITFLAITLISSFLGWSFCKIGEAKNLIPFYPNGVILVIIALLIGAIARLFPFNSDPFILILAVIFFLIFGIIIALILLRLVTYPRDRFRASNYGVIDLVEFIRQLDQAILQQACQEQGIATQSQNLDLLKDCHKSRINLSFIGHSLGCEILTQTIRILSDVFDADSISINNNNNEKHPSREIGHTFTLGRLVLVAPDIPIESILSGRANFLKSSLRRCEGTYVFSNEGDLALRLASTAANYFSFPNKTRARGYKLGNITVKSPQNNRQKLTVEDYGIINLNNHNPPHKYLEVRASSRERIELDELDRNLEKIDKSLIKIGGEERKVSDILTYFDCTDYRENGEGIVSFALRKTALNLWTDYLYLFFAFFLRYPRYIDTHGGYFEGKFSQKLIYDIAFLGFEGLLHSYPQSKLNALSEACQEKGIKVLLSIEHYLST